MSCKLTTWCVRVWSQGMMYISATPVAIAVRYTGAARAQEIGISMCSSVCLSVVRCASCVVCCVLHLCVVRVQLFICPPCALCVCCVLCVNEQSVVYR
jgi:hypothetical protein